MVKSENSNESMSILSGLMVRVGNGRGSTNSCFSSGSTWLEYTCVSPHVWMKSPGFNPHTCAIIQVEQGVRRDVERHAEKDVGATLVKLAA